MQYVLDTGKNFEIKQISTNIYSMYIYIYIYIYI